MGLRGATSLPARRLPTPGLPGASRPVTPCSSRPPPGRARRWWPPTRCTGRSRPVARPSTPPRSRRCPTRSTATWWPTYGPEHVGLLTGDTAVRPEAPVVVMTTEVLRNMLLAGSDLLGDLHTVILDEVHFIQDPYRGGVWEEVLVLSPPEIRFVCLSATVNNAKELGAVAALGPGRHRCDRGAAPPDRPAPPLRGPSTGGRRDAAGAAPRQRQGRWGRPAHRPGGAPGLPGPAGRVAAPGQGPAAAVSLTPAHRADRRPRRRGPAPRHRLHLQPGRLRRRGASGASATACA